MQCDAPRQYRTDGFADRCRYKVLNYRIRYMSRCTYLHILAPPSMALIRCVESSSNLFRNILFLNREYLI